MCIFSNLSVISAEYIRSDESGVEGNEVELVPDATFRTGLMFGTGSLSVSYQFSYTGAHFSDASNALRTPTAIEGLIPSYHVMDVSAEYAFDRYRLEAGVNNLTDHAYFTRRATGYPGPGIIPASGRSLYVGAGITL